MSKLMTVARNYDLDDRPGDVVNAYNRACYENSGFIHIALSEESTAY